MEKVLSKFSTGFLSLAQRLAHYQTIVVITLFYYLILSPIGLLFRLFGWDPLERRGFAKRGQGEPSNWKKCARRHDEISSMRRMS